jgi:hypothetical protein
MNRDFDPNARSFSSLSVKDLLDARDAYHVHLCHLDNVFATAIGRFLIRDTDPDYKRYVSVRERREGKDGSARARTLENSTVRPWSWPCVLVFVTEWETPEKLHKRRGRVVPQFLYLDDGRIIPTCVVKASLYEGPRSEPPSLKYTSHLIGGGYPLLTDVQGAEHVGSVGCVVTDGARLYALSNQHVVGEAGSEVFAVVKGRRSRLGVTAPPPLQIRKRPFSAVYPGLGGANTMVNLDVGLVDVDDAGQWTSKIFGLGRLGPMFNFDSVSASLDWIGCKVVAYGAASGRLNGAIKALFYRYRTVGGADYVSDFLIASRTRKPIVTAPGDSGTLWCVDPSMFPCRQEARRPSRHRPGAVPNDDATDDADDGLLPYRPLAIQWGGQRLSGDDGQFTQFALATSLAVACRELDVDIVTDMRAELPQYWGAVGHYKIAQMAIAMTKGALEGFLEANLERITYDAERLAQDDQNLSDDPIRFVPLADVPDIVWKTTMNPGGKAARPQENWNHYADIDLPGANGKTLDQLCGKKPARLDIAAWMDFYRNAPKPSASTSKAKTVNMGSLPFRVWQVFEEMVAARKAGKKTAFLCAAGILSHYIGDACQPLHGSIHADGLDGASTGVHSAYEEKMIDAFPKEVRTGLDDFAIGKLGPALKKVTTGHEAGVACLELMRRSARRLPPTRICEVYEGLGGGKSKATLQGLWKALGDDTIGCLADGARTLAMLWASAYRQGNAAAFKNAVSEPSLKKTYQGKQFVASLHLANLDPDDYPLPTA